MIKVSIIVPTYRSGTGLDRVMASLDRQTLPADEFEVIFVDDGSPDDTMTRLNAIRARRGNVTVQQIEHTGWPSRPRNVGLEAAVGEYVLFMDHDDELYPEALEAGYNFAKKNTADILNGKETRTDQPKWAIDVYTQNIDNAIGRQDVHPILPTNPHKLFRREFLLQHGIRFPEGKRVPWEDVFFTVEACRHAKVISVLAETPFYHWVRGSETASSSYGKDVGEYWHWINQIFEFTTAQLSDPAHAESLKQLILNQYRTRILAVIGQAFFARSDDDIAIALGVIGRILTEHIPEHYDWLLPKTLQARAYLLRRGNFELLRTLAAIDIGTLGLTSTSNAGWVDDKLRIASTTTWSAAQGKPLSLIMRDGRVLRDLPAVLLAALPHSLVDVTEEVLSATTAIGIRSRETKVTWMLPTAFEVQIDGGDEAAAHISITARTELDIDDAVFGQSLESAVWDLNARNDLLGTLNHRGLRADTAAHAALIGGRSAIAYTSEAGMLSLDIGQNVRSVINSGRPRLGDATASRLSRYSSSASIPLNGVVVTGLTSLTGQLRIGRFPATAATIIGDASGARLEGIVRAWPGRHRITALFEGRKVLTSIIARVSLSGRVRFTRN